MKSAIITLAGKHTRLPVVLFGVCLGVSACMSEASFLQESPSGGVITYSVNENESGLLASEGRHDAIGMMKKKCPNGYRVTNEGVIPRFNRKVDQQWRGQMTTTTVNQKEQRVWGIEFKCN
jgi:hypothetical protein